jgi:hypothetical protein
VEFLILILASRNRPENEGDNDVTRQPIWVNISVRGILFSNSFGVIVLWELSDCESFVDPAKDMKLIPDSK